MKEIIRMPDQNGDLQIVSCPKRIARLRKIESGSSWLFGVFMPILLFFLVSMFVYLNASAEMGSDNFVIKDKYNKDLIFGELLLDYDFNPPAKDYSYDWHNSADFIKKYEGFRRCAYPDLGGGYSIGFGTISQKGECVTHEEAYNRLEYKIKIIQRDIIIPRLGYIPPKDMVVLTDVVFNVRPQNYEYIFRQYEIEDKNKRKQELSYALSRMSYAWTSMTRDECIATRDKMGFNQMVYSEKMGKCRIPYGGLYKRLLARLDLLFT